MTRCVPFMIARLAAVKVGVAVFVEYYSMVEAKSL